MDTKNTLITLKNVMSVYVLQYVSSQLCIILTDCQKCVSKLLKFRDMEIISNYFDRIDLTSGSTIRIESHIIVFIYSFTLFRISVV